MQDRAPTAIQKCSSDKVIRVPYGKRKGFNKVTFPEFLYRGENRRPYNIKNKGGWLGKDWILSLGGAQEQIKSWFTNPEKDPWLYWQEWKGFPKGQIDKHAMAIDESAVHAGEFYYRFKLENMRQVTDYCKQLELGDKDGIWRGRGWDRSIVPKVWINADKLSQATLIAVSGDSINDAKEITVITSIPWVDDTIDFLDHNDKSKHKVEDGKNYKKYSDLGQKDLAKPKEYGEGRDAVEKGYGYKEWTVEERNRVWNFVGNLRFEKGYARERAKDIIEKKVRGAGGRIIS